MPKPPKSRQIKSKLSFVLCIPNKLPYTLHSTNYKHSKGLIIVAAAARSRTVDARSRTAATRTVYEYCTEILYTITHVTY